MLATLFFCEALRGPSARSRSIISIKSVRHSLPSSARSCSVNLAWCLHLNRSLTILRASGSLLRFPLLIGAAASRVEEWVVAGVLWVSPETGRKKAMSSTA